METFDLAITNCLVLQPDFTVLPERYNPDQKE